MLLDTHVLIWYLTDDPRLPLSIKTQIAKQPLVYVSAVVIWEIAIKGSLGKLALGGKLIDSLQAVEEIMNECAAQNFEFLNVLPTHAAQAPFLKGIHKDPFDRLLAAQAQHEGLPLVSGDESFDGLSPNIRRVWTSGLATDLATRKSSRRASKSTG